ncbi:uncharacterized protein SETTUDRAFT_169104 [Exserohilum turcica Et28A]|uniref:Uncharacterized protein n=1 Tax=Exserohilum turcicum (strain 28A) TaxID=671987 RepID=R0KA75_EXST2|nr:uncharacterized protein SETTUDRAFT_169104 [Exserohilum turcica Et28A]EOA86329.1 hypothetical protein SETTUDRAFT_169104 [Exserohilum turcica Et28A]
MGTSRQAITKENATQEQGLMAKCYVQVSKSVLDQHVRIIIQAQFIVYVWPQPCARQVS